MSTLSNVLAFSRAQAQTDSNGLTDAKGIIFANEALLDFHRELITHGVDASQTQESYTSGTANQGTYLYPSDMWFLKAIEVNFRDTSNSGYITANQIDVSNIAAGQSFSWLRTNQNPLFPMFDDRGDQFEIFPTPLGTNNLTNMFRIFYFITPTEYTSTSDSIVYPESLDYRVLGIYIAMSYLQSLTKFDEADKLMEKYQKRVSDLIKTLSRGVQQPIQAIPIQDTGWNL